MMSASIHIHREDVVWGAVYQVPCTVHIPTSAKHGGMRLVNDGHSMVTPEIFIVVVQPVLRAFPSQRVRVMTGHVGRRSTITMCASGQSCAQSATVR